jgi:Protein of unknown function (DUF3182)
MARRMVVLYSPQEPADPLSHDRGARIELARRLASFQDFTFAGEYDPSRPYDGPPYFVPSDTLTSERANQLGIRSEGDLFGGVVPYAFVATKVITHPLVEPDVFAPPGWSREFGHQVHDHVLFGFSVFTHEDARRAGARLLEQGPVRVKPVRASGGQGQMVISSAAELERALRAIDATELLKDGLVVEENLTDVTTYSVGQLRVAEHVASYWGTQRLTPDNRGAAVYGGSDLRVTRGDLASLFRLELPDEVRLAVGHARAYDAAARMHFPGFLASRRNYDIAGGSNAQGCRRLGVLEQSWRIGGASSAEVVALEAFHADPNLRVVQASSVEVYGETANPPANATVFFRGVDDRVGPITKFAVVDRNGNTRG